MSQEVEGKKLITYDTAIERFEYLECLFHKDTFDPAQIMQELHKCFENIQKIIAGNSNSSSLVSLFQIRHRLSELITFLQSQQKKEDASLETASSSKIQSKEMSNTEQLGIIKSTIETPISNGLNEIAGLWEVKKVLKSLIVLPQNQPQLFANRKPCNSVLLFGPPGTGKTRLVQALANEASATLHPVSVSDVLSPLVGQTEKNIEALFNHIKGTENFSILFIDEIDGFCRTRRDSEQDYTRRLKTELMSHMSKLEDNKNIFLIAATNCPWDLDTAFLRRFQKRMYIPLPNSIERHELFTLFTKNIQLEGTSEYWNELINQTEGFSGSDISALINYAFTIPIIELEDTKIWKFTSDGCYEPVVTAEAFKEDDKLVCCELSGLPCGSVRARSVKMLDLLTSLRNITATVSKAEIAKYEAFISIRPQ